MSVTKVKNEKQAEKSPGPKVPLGEQIKQIRAQLAHTVRVRDAALHDVVYLQGRLDCLLDLAKEPAEPDVPEVGPTTVERKANAEEKIRAVIEKRGTARAKQAIKSADPSVVPPQ